MDRNEANELAHLYVDGAFNRREMIRRARRIVGGVAAVSAALNAMGVPLKAADACANSLRVPADAEDLEGADVEFTGEASSLMGYLAKPRRESTDPLAAVVVIHENQGLTEHIRDVTRRIARAGFIALGIDLLSRQGGTAQYTDAQQRSQAYGRTTIEGQLSDLKMTVAYLRTLGDVRAERIGCVGFCAGGGNVWQLAVNETTAANVVYYGTAATAGQIPNLNGPILLHYGQRDRNNTISGTGAISALLAANKVFGFHIWEGAAHAFQ